MPGAVTLSPNDAATRLVLAMALRMVGRLADGITAVRRGLLFVGSAYLAKGDAEQALDWLQRDRTASQADDASWLRSHQRHADFQDDGEPDQVRASR